MFYSQTNKSTTELDFATIPNIPASSDDEEFEITPKYEHRPDILSNDIYGSPKYWPVFQLRNMDIMEDPIYDLTAGKTIMIPHPKTIKRLK